jgi:hypothetical protein
METNWVLFCKRTEDPKLAWIEHQLDLKGIPHRRNGDSFHAPILEVPEDREEDAEEILTRRIGRYTVDDIRDDHPRWQRELDAIPAPDEELGLGGREFWS